MAMTSSPMMNVEAAAERLGCSVKHVRNMIYERRIPYFKVGRLIRFDPDVLENWVQSNRVDPEPPLKR